MPERIMIHATLNC